MRKNWRKGCCLAAVVLLLLGVCTITALGDYEWGVGSNIDRGDLELTVDETDVTVEVDKSVTVAIDADPWEDEQLPGCEMAECPEKCGEQDCLTEDGLNCKCGGEDWETYETEITISSSDTGIATASYSDQEVKIKGVGEGTATITVTGTLREWKKDKAEITVTVTAAGDNDDSDSTPRGGGGGGGGGGSSAAEEKEALTVSYNEKGSVTISTASLKRATEIKVTGAVELVLDADAVKTIGAEKDLTVSAVKADNKTLSADLQQKIGDRPVFDIDITSGGQAVTDLSPGKLQISIPYTLGAEEKAEQIVLYYIDADGKAREISGAHYDAAAKAVVFTTDHLSRYAIGYKEPVSFTDVPDTHWAAGYILDLANKGIVGGKTATTFAPNDTITRGEFVKILAGVAGADVPTVTASSFSDVAPDAWYAPYVAWAGENGIAKGEEGKFNPNARISRQDMAAMLARYIQDVAQKTLPEKNAAVTFTDEAAIGAYAKEAVGMMQQAGIIGGNEAGAFLPTHPATRAEAAKMISVLMEILGGDGK